MILINEDVRMLVKKIISALMLSTLSSCIFAMSELGLKNTTEYYFVLSGNTAEKASCKGKCYELLKTDGEQWVQLLGPASYIDVQYNVCKQINYSQKDICDGYLGHVGISFSEKETKISNVDNGKASISKYVAGKAFDISFTSDDKPPIHFPTPTTYKNVPHRGVNLTGAEYDYAFQLPDAESALYFVKKGMNSIRIPFKWEYLQPAAELGKPLDFNKGNAKKYAALVKQLTDAKITVIIDMHNYMRYQSGVIGVDSIATTQHYSSIWSDFARQYKDNPYVIFDLMNEPHDLNPADLIKNYNAAIAAIRTQGFNNIILLEGSAWSGLESWTDGEANSNANVFANGAIHDPKNNYAINVHQYYDHAGGGTRVCQTENLLQTFKFQAFLDWLRANKVAAFLTETGGAANEGCASAINQLLTAVEANPASNIHEGGFLGWNGWDAGRNTDNGPYRKDDLFYLGDFDTPEKIQMQQGFNLHLTAPAQ